MKPISDREKTIVHQKYKWHNIVYGFCQTTTIHGMKQLSDADFIIRR